jgi:hypothetical protein
VNQRYEELDLKGDDLEFLSTEVAEELQDMVRHRTGTTQWRQEITEEEHAELVHSIQALQIQVHGLSTQLLTTMEILEEQRQGQHQL